MTPVSYPAMETFGLKTTRYSVVLRRLIEACAHGAEFRIDRRRFTEDDLPWLLGQWCTNKNVKATRDFEIRRQGAAIAGFHDGPSELWVAASERPLVDQLISEKLARMNALPSPGRITSRMPRFAKLLLAVVLLAVAGFCVFGFLATYESPGFAVWRVSYAAVGLVALLGAGGLIFSSRGGPSRRN